ncbi:MAG: diguanylate cyclase [Caldilineaceae bacterium]|nr:diguanylate cyclase [Caldilineaceae bacterium]
MNNETSIEARRLRLLLVEDNLTDQKLLQAALRKPVHRSGQMYSFAVDCTGTIAEALAALQQNEYDIVVTDLYLPQSEGVETIERLLEVAHHLPVVVLSGLDDEELALTAVRLGVQDYLVKATYSTSTLVRTLLYAIERKQMEQRLAAIARTEVAQDGEERLDNLLRRICELTRQFLPATGAGLVLWDKQQQEFNLGVSNFPGLEEPDIFRRLRPCGGITRWIIDNKRPVVVSDMASSALPFNQSVLIADHKSFVGVPLLNDNEALGVLYVINQQNRLYRAADMDFLVSLAQRAAAAVVRIQLYQQIRAALRETDNLYQATRSLIASTNMQETLTAVVEGTRSVLNANAVTVVRVNPEEKRLESIVFTGDGVDVHAARSFEEFWDGLGGWAIRNQTVAFSPGGVPDERESAAAQARRMTTGAGSVLVAPLNVRGRLIATLTAINRPEQPNFTPSHIKLIELLGNQAAMAIENAELFARTEQLANIDGLTGISNRRFFFETAQNCFATAQSHNDPVAVLLVDLDHFKQINDQYGHAMGDQVLSIVAKRIRAGLREHDIFGRYGGEEFVLLLPGATAKQASATAERLRRRIEMQPIAWDGHQALVTISIGGAIRTAECADLSSLIRAADRALYLSKERGRNRVSLWDENNREWQLPNEKLLSKAENWFHT